MLVGGDTVATERFTRTDDRLDATIRLRTPATAPSPDRYEATLRPDASVAGLVATAAGAPAGSVTFQGDSAVVVQGADTLRRAVPRGAVVYIDPSAALMEQIVRRARALGGTRGGPAVSVPVFLAGSGGQTEMAAVTFPAADSAHVALGKTAVALRVDRAGAVLGGSDPAQHLTIVRSIGTASASAR